MLLASLAPCLCGAWKWESRVDCVGLTGHPLSLCLLLGILLGGCLWLGVQLDGGGGICLSYVQQLVSCDMLVGEMCLSVCLGL